MCDVGDSVCGLYGQGQMPQKTEQHVNISLYYSCFASVVVFHYKS